MASYDDRQWIFSLIQNAYVTTDDTGLCEEILHNDQGITYVTEFPFFTQDDTSLLNPHSEPEPHSPPITTDRERTRYRTYTERQSERIKKEREKASRTKRITWKHDPSLKIDESELSEMFKRKAVFSRSSDTSDGEPPPPTQSLLSHLLSNSEYMNTNAFIDYSKFDGVTHNNVASKQMDIYLYVGSKPCLDYPLRVCVICSAKVSELIGLICWIYTKENREPPLKTIDYYQLYIAEEDGQYDGEFMPLEKGSCVDKYRFGTLALIEKDVPDSDEGIIVTVNFARGAFSKIEVSNTDVTLKEILNKSISRRKEIAKIKEAGVDYHLEKEDEPGVALKLEKTLGQVQCTEFAAVRDNSKRSDEREIRRPSIIDMNASQSFSVSWVQKFSKYETRIDISSDKFEIHPSNLKSGGSILPLRTPVSLIYHINQIIDCTIKPMKKGKVEVHITVRGEDSFKGFKFLCEPVVGEALYNKCRYLIKLNARTLSKANVIDVVKPYFRRHDSLSFRKKPKSENASFEV